MIAERLVSRIPSHRYHVGSITLDVHPDGLLCVDTEFKPCGDLAAVAAILMAEAARVRLDADSMILLRCLGLELAHRLTTLLEDDERLAKILEEAVDRACREADQVYRKYEKLFSAGVDTTDY